MFAFQNTKKINRTEFNYLIAIPNGNASKHGAFFTQQYALLLSRKTTGLLDDFYGRLLAKIGLTQGRIELPGSIEDAVGLGGCEFDLAMMALRPVQNIVGP